MQFVYPYSLEVHVLSPAAPHLSHSERIRALKESHEQRLSFLQERENDKLQKRREQMRKIGPGWEPPDDNGLGDPATKRTSGILEPTKKAAITFETVPADTEPASYTSTMGEGPRDVMDDLVEGLAKLDQLEKPQL